MVMVPRVLLLVWIAAAAGGACGSAARTPGGGTAGVSGGASCDHDGCVVPLSQAGGSCPATFVETGANCPGVTRRYSECAPFRYVQIVSVGPSHDCYYDAQSDELVGAVLRSDAGFTKVAGDVPTQACPAANVLLCDHSGAGGAGGSNGGAGTWGGGVGGAGGTWPDITKLPCEVADDMFPVSDAGTSDDAGVSCPATGIISGENCPRPRLQCGSCTCHLCRFYGGELYIPRWSCP